MIDASVEQGTGAIVYDHGTTNIDFGADTASEMRLFRFLNSTVIDSWAGVGDMPTGAVQTWGMYNVRGHLGRLVQVRLHHRVGRQSVLHAHPRDPLHARGALPGRQVRGDRARLQRDRRPRRHLAQPARRHRRGARARDGAGDARGEPPQRRVRARADRPADPGARGHRPLPARVRPAQPAAATDCSTSGTRRSDALAPVPGSRGEGGTLDRARRAASVARAVATR